jgi:hypothetical protein
VVAAPRRETADQASGRKREEAETRNRRHRETREAKAALEKTRADLAATEAELADLTERLGNPTTYADAALVRRLIEDHNQALDRTATLTSERDRLTAELETAEASG